MSCCCIYGAAVSDEWPEFPCGDCPVHGEDSLEFFGPPDHYCRRHRKDHE